MKKLYMMLGILLLSSLSFAQITTQNVTTFTTASQAPVIVNNIGSGTHFYRFTWNVTGTVSACTIALDSSPDGTTWTAGGIIAGQACTTNGTFTSGSVTFNYYRINPNASITGTGSVIMNTSGYATNPAGGGVAGCITVVASLSASCGTTAGTIASVTDGSTASDCTTGSGTNKNACIYSGTVWNFAGSAAGAPAFSAITPGTNTGALVIGTGGSLTVSGSGTNNATNINGVSMASLATGIYKNTTATGVPVIATANTDYTTPSGNITGTSGGLTGIPNITVGTITPTTISGGAFSGTFTGTPTFSGNIAFTGTPTFSNTLALNTTGTSGGLTGSPAITVSSCTGCAGGAPAWSTITNPSGNLSLTMGTNTSIFGTTTAVAGLFQFNNSTAATVTVPQSSPSIRLGGTEFHAAASTVGSVDMQFVPGVGTDAVSTFNITHVGSATGAMTLQNSGPIAAGSDGVHPSYFTMIGNTTQPTVPPNTVGFMGPPGTTFTGYSCQLPVTSPSGGQVLSCGTPNGSGVATGTWVSNGAGTITNIATTSPITGGPITSTGTIACATCGVTGTGLNQFASTTSAQLAGVLSDETGTGLAVFGTNPVLTTPNLGTPSAVTLTNGTGLLTTRTVSVSFGIPAGTAISTGTLGYVRWPYACTGQASYSITVDAGTATIKTWKIAAGTAIPTVTNSISTSGVSISSGTNITSTTVTDFTTHTTTADDIFGFNLGTVSGVGYINFEIVYTGCTQ